LDKHLHPRTCFFFLFRRDNSFRKRITIWQSFYEASVDGVMILRNARKWRNLDRTNVKVSNFTNICSLFRWQQLSLIELHRACDSTSAYGGRFMNEMDWAIAKMRGRPTTARTSTTWGFWRE
jgi:hypothetical protein